MNSLRIVAGGRWQVAGGKAYLSDGDGRRDESLRYHHQAAKAASRC